MSWELTLNLIESGSVVAASIVALATVNNWRAEQRRERQLQAATEALELAYEAADTVKAVRSVFGISTEGSTRKRLPDEPERLTQALDDAYAPIERFNQHAELFAKLRGARYRMMAEFGSQWKMAFDEIFNFRAKLISRANMAMRIALRESREQRPAQTTEQQQKLLDELEALRWEADDKDAVNTEIAKVVYRLDELNASIRQDTLLNRASRRLTKLWRAKAKTVREQEEVTHTDDPSDGITILR